MDKDLPQDIEETRGDNRCAKTSQGYDEDCSRSQHIKIIDSGLYFYFSSFILFFFHFLFLEQLGLGLIGHAVTSVTT